MPSLSVFDSIEQSTCVVCGARSYGALDCGYCDPAALAASDPRVRERIERANAMRERASILGTPAGADYCRVTYSGALIGDRWTGWTIEDFGTICTALTTWPPSWPWVAVPAGDGAAIVQVWSRSARLSELRPWLELRWHPDAPMSIDLRGIADAPYEEAAKTLRGMKLLRAMSKPGPIPGTTKWYEGTFRVDLDKAFDELLRDEGKIPSRARVADRMAMTYSTFRNYLRDFNIPWPPG